MGITKGYVVLLIAIAALVFPSRVMADDFSSRRSLGIGGGLPYGGVGINYEIGDLFGSGLRNLTVTMGAGATDSAAFLAGSLRYYLFGRDRRVQYVPSLSIDFGYDWQDRKVDYRLGFGNGVLVFFSRRISVEASLIYEVRFGLLVHFGIRYHHE